MKGINRSVLVSMVAVWAMCLMFLVVDHVVVPGDRWGQMFFHPLPLIFVPLVAACIPLLAVRRIEGVRDDSDEDFEARWIRSKKFKQAAMVWLASLVVFGLPQRYDGLDWLFHKPVFLIVAPLALACIPLLVSDTGFVRRPARPLSRRQLFVWRVAHGLCHLLVGLDLLTLITFHSSDSEVHGSLALNVVLVLGFVVLVPMQIWTFMRIRDAKAARESVGD